MKIYKASLFSNLVYALLLILAGLVIYLNATAYGMIPFVIFCLLSLSFLFIVFTQTYIKIDEHNLISSYFSIKHRISIDAITQIGWSELGSTIHQSRHKVIDIYTKDSTGNKVREFRINTQPFSKKKIFDFVANVLQVNPLIQIDPELEVFLKRDDSKFRIF